jgi:hypothetical protein
MQTLFYSSLDDRNSKRLAAAVHQVIPESQIEPFNKMDDFRERLRRPVEPDSIAVLSASNREELQQMQPLRGLLTEIYIVLVIPDRKKSTIELAHLLLPRFLSQKNDDFTALGKVLDKMYRTARVFPEMMAVENHSFFNQGQGPGPAGTGKSRNFQFPVITAPPPKSRGRREPAEASRSRRPC